MLDDKCRKTEKLIIKNEKCRMNNYDVDQKSGILNSKISKLLEVRS
jgi:hypothetical protein